MAEYTKQNTTGSQLYRDKTVDFKAGYGDTNINVFTLASLPFNDVFDYFGINTFGDKTSAIISEYTKQGVEASDLFDKDTSWAYIKIGLALASEDGEVMTDEGGTPIAMEGLRERESNFIDETTDE